MNLWGSTIDLNTAKGPTVPDPGNLKKFYHDDVTRIDEKSIWTTKTNSNISINSVVPAHEPWIRQTGQAVTDTGFVVGQVLEAASLARKDVVGFAETKGTIAGGFGSATNNKPTNTASSAASGSKTPIARADATGKPSAKSPVQTTSSNDATTSSAGVARTDGIVPSDLSSKDAPPVTIGVGGLSPEQTQALKAQISHNESRGDYGAVNQFNYLGRYQVGGAVLQDQGLLRPEFVKKYGNKAALHPAAWTSKAHKLGITNQGDFLANSAVQEQVMDNLLVSNSKTLKRIGGLRTGDDAGTVGGMLQTAQLLGAGGAKSTEAADKMQTELLALCISIEVSMQLTKPQHNFR